MSARVCPGAGPRGLRALSGPALAAVLWLAAATAAQAATVNECLECHRMQDERRLAAPTQHFAEDIHAQRGFTCAACHGGDPSVQDIEGMDPDKGYIGKPKRSEIAALCAKCHADAAFMKRYNPQPYIFSVDEWRTSVHCKKAALGDVKVATCTDCHGVHGILPHKDPASPVYKLNVPQTCAHCHNPEYMKGRTVRTDQYALYKGSVHGIAVLEKKDLSAPVCNNCHGNHGAVPPNTRDISVVCGNCHGREGELFESSKVKASLELEGKRGCVTCHGNHDVQKPTDAMIGVGEPGVCGRCHQSGSAGERATGRIVTRFRTLKGRLDEADSLLARAERLGMPTEKARETLKQAADQLVNVRVVLHSFDSNQIDAVLTEGTGQADQAVTAGQRALKDWRTRRVGMGLSLIAIGVVIGLLLLLIRQVESRPGTGRGGGSATPLE
ncbi:MAG: cytochrome c3 family protein [Candidatus Eisenbacteria bacterium]